MSWLKIPNNTRVEMKSEFKEVILTAKGKKTWNEFENKIGISKHIIRNYIYGKKPRYKPSIQILKTLVENSLITALEIENLISWNENLFLLSKQRPSLNEILIKKGDNEFIDLERYCKGLIITGNKDKNYISFPLKSKKIGNYVKIWYESEFSGKKSHPFLLKKYICLNEETFIAFGLIQAESCKKPGYLFFDFTNNDPILLNYIKTYFEKYWFVKGTDWKCIIHYWRPHLNKNRRNELITYWKNKLKIPVNNISLYHGIKYRCSKKASYYGTASIRVFNKAFRSVVIDFLEKIINNVIFSDKKYLNSYLTGLFSGDGTLSKHKEKFRFIGLSFDPNSDEIETYYKILKKINIPFNTEKLITNNRRLIPIINWKDHLKLLKATGGRLFLDKRNDVFIEGFLKNQYVKPLIRLKDIKNNQPITVKSYSHNFNCTKRSAVDRLKRLVKLNLLRYNKKELPYKFYLTDYGNDFLKLMDNLQNTKGVSYE